MSAAAPCKPARERMRAEAEGGEAHATTKKNKKGGAWFLSLPDNFIYLFLFKNMRKLYKTLFCNVGP